MLSPEQQNTLAAVLNRVIPPDEFPGAWEAGVGDYLAQQFRQEFAEIVSTYRLGLDCIDAEARAAAGRAFAELPADAQDTALTRIDEGEVIFNWPFPPRRFFRMIVQHAMEGFYADPGNGGNKDGVGWAMVGYEVTG